MGKQQNLIYENFAFARCVLKNLISNKGVIMLRNDLFKFLFLFVFVISLVSMVGCGDDDGEGGGGDFISKECDICPCKYFDVPITAQCWPEPTFDGSSPVSCLLSTPVLGALIQIFETDTACMIIDGAEACPQDDQLFLNLTAEERAACSDCLAQYATRLNRVVPVNGQQPFMCTASQ